MGINLGVKCLLASSHLVKQSTCTRRHKISNKTEFRLTNKRVRYKACKHKQDESENELDREQLLPKRLMPANDIQMVTCVKED
jgi:hypothetical protein